MQHLPILKICSCPCQAGPKRSVRFSGHFKCPSVRYPVKMGPPKGDSVIRPHPPANRSPAQAGGASAPYGRLTLMPPGATVQPSAALRPIYRVFYTSAGHVHCRGGRAMDAKKVGASDTKLAPTWRSRRDSNPRAVLAATRFPVVLVMTTSILLQIIVIWFSFNGQQRLL